MAFLQNSKLCAQTFRKIPHFLDVRQFQNADIEALSINFAYYSFLLVLNHTSSKER